MAMRRGGRLLGLLAKRLTAESGALTTEAAGAQAPRYFSASALRNPAIAGAPAG